MSSNKSRNYLKVTINLECVNIISFKRISFKLLFMKFSSVQLDAYGLRTSILKGNNSRRKKPAPKTNRGDPISLFTINVRYKNVKSRNGKSRRVKKWLKTPFR